MKFIHCADLHLDSPLQGVANAKLRRQELFDAMCKMFVYAQNLNVDGVIIAGDLFDGVATEATIKNVAQLFNDSKLPIYVLKGNHGNDNSYVALQQQTNANVCYFGNDFTYYQLGNVCICGIELDGATDQVKWQGLSLQPNNYNVVVLHGDVDSPAYGLIDKATLASSNAHYVALGHRHFFATHKAGKVPMVYSGVLESRGFDESFPTGFVVVDTDAHTYTFVPQAIRKVSNVTVDVTPCANDVQLYNAIMDATASELGNNYLNLTLVGSLSKDVSVCRLKDKLAGRHFALRVDDKTSVAMDVDALLGERSLRGTFAALAMEISDERTRNDVLRLGIAALMDEEVDL
ncbi:MAG: metallophosphoesterase [Clostridia bacterium]|nr:metallophosphoesterase [Clostridia bacterium]